MCKADVMGSLAPVVLHTKVGTQFQLYYNFGNSVNKYHTLDTFLKKIPRLSEISYIYQLFVISFGITTTIPLNRFSQNR